MHRKAVLVVMLLALLWQSVALARVGSTINVLSDYQHASLHWLDEGHHHHDDGSYHADDSAESACHMVADHVCSPLGLMAHTTQFAVLVGSAAPASPRGGIAAAPFIEGPLRPPRLRA